MQYGQHDAKRPRYNQYSSPGSVLQQRQMDAAYMDPREQTAPSPVLHVRNLPDEANSEEIVSYLGRFGTIKYIVMLPKTHQALVEMDSIASATEVLRDSRSQPIYIGNRTAQFNYSKSQEINRDIHTTFPNSEVAHQGERTLLLTIFNPIYPVTVDVLYQILSPHGNVQRIVVFNKNGVQALAEFDAPEAAVRARTALDGKDIYNNCCKLRITYSKIERLNVRYNSEKTRDFTDPRIPHAPPPMQAPPPGAPMQPYHSGHPQMQPYYMQNTPVLILHGLDPSINCDHLFNLFCLYGNVVKIKLLNKPGTALVQMGDAFQSELALRNLGNCLLFGSELSVSFSKHLFIGGNPPPPAENEDPSVPAPPPTLKDYSTSMLNRYIKVPPNLNKHIYPPTPVVFFSNSSPALDETSLKNFFTSQGAQEPAKVKFFDIQPPPGAAGHTNPDGSSADGASAAQPERTRRVGLCEWPDAALATDAIVLCNNSRFDGQVTRLSFSMNEV